jgi:hypothetical protein
VPPLSAIILNSVSVKLLQVDVGRIGFQRAPITEILHKPGNGVAAADMDRDRRANLAGYGPGIHHLFERTGQARERQREQLIAAGKILRAQAADIARIFLPRVISKVGKAV